MPKAKGGTELRRIVKPLMLEFYPQFWTKAFDFEGRTTRIDYWKIFLVNLVLGIILYKLFPSAIYYIFTFAAICPGIAMNVRRIRDTGRQWQWIFILFVPIIGGLWFIWIGCQPSSSPE
jgi:uncharacterized membrane protein YhaH (DUF805 family)|tara:strand:+ start:845 stop:1201 length:357 start_codon:yes stop_codon:yes gene_type:complete